MHKRLIYTASFIAFVIMLAMLNFSTPAGVGPLGVLLFFTTVYVVLFGLVVLVFTVVRGMLGKSTNFGGKTYLYAAVVAFGPVILLLMQGANGVRIWTVALTAVMVALGCFLVSKKA